MKRQLTTSIGVSILALFSMFGHAQQASDIVIGELKRTDSGVNVVNVRAITDNQEYTNQPYFFDDSTLYYTQEVDGQMDIFRYNVEDDKHTNVTQSPDSEYSATPTTDGMGFSVIKVNSEGKQELWKMSFGGQPKLHLSPAIEPVGYHAWTMDDKVVLFVLGEPHTLRYADPLNLKDEGVTLASDIGASIYPVPLTNQISYSVNQKDKGAMLYAFNPVSGKQSTLVELPQGAAYYAWTPKTELLTVSNNELVIMPFLVTPEGLVHTVFSTVKIESDKCKEGISRIAVSPYNERIALVCNRS